MDSFLFSFPPEAQRFRVAKVGSLDAVNVPNEGAVKVGAHPLLPLCSFGGNHYQNKNRLDSTFRRQGNGPVSSEAVVAHYFTLLHIHAIFFSQKRVIHYDLIFGKAVQ